MATSGQVGVFWLVCGADGQVGMPWRAASLEVAEPYGDCLTFGEGHYETWLGWQAGVLRLPAATPALLRAIAEAEYEEWPRGRVVYERTPDRFVIYADRQAFAHRARIEAGFGLPSGRTAMRTDLHYQSSRRLPAVPKTMSR